MKKLLLVLCAVILFAGYETIAGDACESLAAAMSCSLLKAGTHDKERFDTLNNWQIAVDRWFESSDEIPQKIENWVNGFSDEIDGVELE
ncbi:MAG: hypothetical protein AB7D36_12145 [Oscillospiraceae bacterium]